MLVSYQQELFEKHKLDKMSHSERGRRLWNCDETGICTAVASRKILTKRGAKNVHETGGGSGREYITILTCGSAIGEKMPPYIVYKGTYHMQAHMRGDPPGTKYSRSESGWMESANFLEWFRTLFLPAVDDIRHTGPVILFLDGHQSHASLPLVETARVQGIILYSFPPHTTHLLQPLDVGVYGPLKQVWSQVLKGFKLETMGAKVDKEVFPTLVAQMWPRVLLPEHLIGGFRAAGLHPLSHDAIPVTKLKISFPFPQESSPQPSQSQHQQHRQQSQPLPGTPVSIHIAQFFGNLFLSQQCKITEQAGRQIRIQPRHYGEALTEEEVIERLRQQAEQKAELVRQREEKKEERARQQEEKKEERARQQEERIRQREEKKVERARQ